MEVTCVVPPRSFLRELREVLPGVHTHEHTRVLITCQRARMDLVGVGPEVAVEKDLLLERFVAFAEAFRARALELYPGAWVDYVDPCSGLPVDALETLLRYRTSNAGCCKIVLHPRWGSAVYPATMFFQGMDVADAEDVARSVAHTAGLDSLLVASAPGK